MRVHEWALSRRLNGIGATLWSWRTESSGPAEDGEPGTIFMTSNATAQEVPAVRAVVGPEI